jgi:hypothetical protein
MKKFLSRLVMTAAFALALAAVAPNANAYYCAQWDPTGLTCLLYSVDLIPNASWCGANPSPASNEVLIYMTTNYTAGSQSTPTNALCQRVVVNSSFQVSNLQNYNLDGPQQHIQSIWLGHNVFVAMWSGNFVNNYHYLCGYNNGGSCPSSFYYNADIHGNWGFYPQSLAFGVES